MSGHTRGIDPKLLIALGLTGVWFLVAASCGEDGGAGTPEQVAAKWTSAMRANAFGELPGLIVPKDRDFVAASLAALVAHAPGETGFAQLAAKYKLDPDAKKLAAAKTRAEFRKAAGEYLGKVDRARFIADLLPILKRHGDVGVPAGDLTGLVISGDDASGRLGGRPVSFQRLGGKWYITIPDE